MEKINNPLVEAVVEGMKDNKAHNITILDLRGLDGASADFYVIADGTSNTQVESIAESIVDRVREDLNDRPLHYEGRGNATWILVDYHDVIAHVFMPEQRAFYDIEGLWSDAKREDIPDDI
ncbi:MAG: ribosome silencing factor [Bacteroidales bacterium]|nr:ribosome silencing factor [Bacteroidales bacterium]MDY4175824.1 ribosome silencing factor [Bacteroidales bacterium]